MTAAAVFPSPFKLNIFHPASKDFCYSRRSFAFTNRGTYLETSCGLDITEEDELEKDKI